MNNEKTIKTWQTSIIKECENRLERELTDLEKTFIESRGSFIALETIEDTVKSITGKELETYLNAESNEQ